MTASLVDAASALDALELMATETDTDCSEGLVFVRTEPHVLGRVFGADRAAGSFTFDVSDLATMPRGRRLAGAARLDQRIATAKRELQDARVVVCDTSEGWLTSTVVRRLRRLCPPSCTFLGLQHGVLEVSALQRRPVLRRLRGFTSDAAVRLAGVSPIGAGFGNTRFDGYLALSARDAAYITNRWPECLVRVAPDMLLGLTRRRALLNSDTRCDVLVLLQDLAFYGPKTDHLVPDLLDEVAELARTRGLIVMVRPHPKAPDQARMVVDCGLALSAAPDFVADVDRDTTVVSFFSTGLVEAHALGLATVAVTHKLLPTKNYERLPSSRVSTSELAQVLPIRGSAKL